MANHIHGPQHLHPGVIGVEDYYRQQLLQLQNLRKNYPNGDWPDAPWVYIGEPIKAFVTNGQWQIMCVCGNAPLVNPAWELALCYECFAIHKPPMLVVPKNYKGIEAVLLARPDPKTRAWLPAESVADLQVQNIAHGVPLE